MANGNCRSPFHKLKIIEKRKKNPFYLLREQCPAPLPVLLHTRKALLMVFVPSDGQAHQNLLKYSAVNKMQFMPMGQHCSKQLLPRDLLKHLPVLFQYRLAEGKRSSFKERSAL